MKLIKVKPAAILLDVSDKTIREMLMDGRLKGKVIRPKRKGGRAIYRVDENFLKSEFGGIVPESAEKQDEPTLHLDKI